MENRKEYHMPSAEIVLLVPSEAVSTGSPFKKNNGWWGQANSWWSDAFETPKSSVITAGAVVPDSEETNSWTLP